MNDAVQGGAEPEAGRELDMQVAERVMGWTPVENYGTRTGFWDPDGEYGAGDRVCWEDEIPPYSTDAAADYTVLQHVRATWDEVTRRRFHRRLNQTWLERQVEEAESFPPLAYEPGDYARAALATATTTPE